MFHSIVVEHLITNPRNTTGGSITVTLTSCLTGLDQSFLQIKTKIVSSHIASQTGGQQYRYFPLQYSLTNPDPEGSIPAVSPHTDELQEKKGSQHSPKVEAVKENDRIECIFTFSHSQFASFKEQHNKKPMKHSTHWRHDIQMNDTLPRCT